MYFNKAVMILSTITSVLATAKSGSKTGSTTATSKTASVVATSKAGTSAATACSTFPSTLPGYDEAGQYVSSNVNGSFSFGQHYAVLNLDLINGIVGGVASTSEGKAFIQNTKTWIDAVHAQNPAPLSIFSRVYFANARKPEVKPGSAFSKSSLGNASDPLTQIYPAFNVDYAAGDVVVQKTGYSATRGNALLDILQAQGIDTVILSGIRTSGVILSTTYVLFDAGYTVYIIANNTIEPSPNGPAINLAILTGVAPKLPVNVITIEQALKALAKSGPAVY